MSYNERDQHNNEGHIQRSDTKSSISMTRRSPSILVTDSRYSKNRVHAPFAGHAATSGSWGLTNTHVQLKRQNTNNTSSNNSNTSNTYGSFNEVRNNQYGPNIKGRHEQIKNGFAKSKLRRKSKGQFSEITLDNILSQSSDIPSGRPEQRRTSSSSSSAAMERFSNYERLRVSSNYRKMINPLPTRKSKISQKLVLIPEENSLRDNVLFNSMGRSVSRNTLTNIQESDTRNLTMDKLKYKNKQKQNLPRLTAYNIADGFNLKVMSKFLKKTHEVSPRLYDDCLYVPYVLPLLPGKDGFRIKSNISKRTVGGKTIMDKLIETSEMRDHHYEYYSGVETVEDMNNNYELETAQTVPENKNDPATVIPDHLPGPTTTNPDAFNPSEPQFFAEERAISEDDDTGLPNESNKPIHNNGDNGVSDNILPTADKFKRDVPNNILNRPNEAYSTITSDNDADKSTSLLINHAEKKHSEIFIFHYGVVVFWNFTETQEKNILGDITFADNKTIIHKPLDEQDIEIEEFHFEYDMETERPRIFNDVVTLRSGDHIIKLTLSYAIAQSSKLSRFESRISPILTAVTKLPKRLALYGTLGLKREQLLKKSGKLFKLRVDVNLSSSVLDTPDFFWSVEPSLHPLYVAMREYLEIDKRVQVVNDRCKVFLEFFDICVDSVAERNMARVTWWFIIVILLGVLFSLSEILVRYNIIHNRPT
ncbi:similar to Saccharomyces cerevisiae YFR048W RMD8 Cytosolic protein required for sporulation [Maudiozyma barnettii]|uniref:Similar to Saccharomyces cerevisiae YFR048W RMD8 Cytosolic protein required for sporulation n=1 Tax=Maudiozyma barnettii TaxID=61262 RepID=A0A8H2VIZ3_9SACH|nr:Rmd8p [Kazachstania barnettii]CAB4256230.1 similar to Saccharomyces cerevisiae YFR048W RMD8 Cytosolic protein required for sporulation [Kazachstania barnettii]CAD1784839.1 similar to Saccharomyces cerevisiae YFR048W RMD8 Cytosolic protein required for sporulation [Kazachstania barnettii]